MPHLTVNSQIYIPQQREHFFLDSCSSSLRSYRYVDGLDSVDDLEEHSASTLMCLVEEPAGKNTSDVAIGMVTICPSTGDVVWDDFNGN